MDWHVGREICSCIESKLHGFFTIFNTGKKNPQDWHIILYQSPTKSSMDYFMIFETQKIPQDLQLLVAQVLSAFHMCNIMQHHLGLFLSWEMVEHCEVTDLYMLSAFKALWMVKRQQVYCSFCEQYIWNLFRQFCVHMSCFIDCSSFLCFVSSYSFCNFHVLVYHVEIGRMIGCSIAFFEMLSKM